MEKAGLMAAILLVWWVFFRYLLAPLTPVVIGLLVALATLPLTARLERVMSRSLAALLSVVVAYLALLGVAGYLGYRLVAEVNDLARTFDTAALAGRTQDLIPPQLAPWVDPLQGKVSEEAVKAISGSTHVLLTSLARLPETAIGTVVAMVATYFIARNLPAYWDAFLGAFTPVWRRRLNAAVEKARHSLLGYVLAQGSLAVITFVLTLLMMVGLDRPYALTMSGLAALSEMVPVIGATIFFIPWSLWLLATGEAAAAWGVLVIFFVVASLRRVLEPKIIGKHADISPLAALVSMLLGLKAAGVLGVLVGPLVWSVSLAMIDDAHLEEPVTEDNGAASSI